MFFFLILCVCWQWKPSLSTSISNIELFWAVGETRKWFQPLEVWRLFGAWVPLFWLWALCLDRLRISFMRSYTICWTWTKAPYFQPFSPSSWATSLKLVNELWPGCWQLEEAEPMWSIDTILQLMHEAICLLDLEWLRYFMSLFPSQNRMTILFCLFPSFQQLWLRGDNTELWRGTIHSDRSRLSYQPGTLYEELPMLRTKPKVRCLGGRWFGRDSLGLGCQMHN